MLPSCSSKGVAVSRCGESPREQTSLKQEAAPVEAKGTVLPQPSFEPLGWPLWAFLRQEPAACATTLLRDAYMHGFFLEIFQHIQACLKWHASILQSCNTEVLDADLAHRCVNVMGPIPNYIARQAEGVRSCCGTDQQRSSTCRTHGMRQSNTHTSTDETSEVTLCYLQSLTRLETESKQ